MGKRVLVTGATGNAGRYVVPALLDAGYEVRGQFRRARGPDDRVDWRQFDFMSSKDLSELVEGCDAVVHCAAQLHNVSLMQLVNVEATEALARAADAAGCKYFGYASSIVVHGSPERAQVAEETPRIDPHKPLRSQYYAEPYVLGYARSKVLAEQALERLETDMAIDLWRPVVIVENDRLLESGDWSLARRVFALYRRTQYIHAMDAAAAIVHLVQRGLETPRGRRVEAWNICDHEAGTYRELQDFVFERTGDQRFKTKPDIPVVADVLKNSKVACRPALRKSLGMLEPSNAKLRASGFEFPLGFRRALERAIDERMGAAAPA